MRTAFVDALLEEAKHDSSIVLVTGDLGFGVLDKFQAELPNQFINAGVTEQAMLGMAAGIASTGKRVFVYSIANFPTFRCLEQIRNDVCLMNNPVVVVSVGAGYAYGSQGYTHHALEDIAVMRSLPNMEVVVPCDSQEATLATKLLARNPHPSYLRLGKNGEPRVHRKVIEFSVGKIVEIDKGNDGTILFSGSIGEIAIKAREFFLQKGKNITVASVPFISSIDADYLASICPNGPIITLEEHSGRGGLGSAILECASNNRISADIRIVAASQKDLSQIGDQNFLRNANGLSVEKIVEAFAF
jgi:transketolase